MLVSLKWLKDYVNINVTAEELAEKLTMAGLEVDEIKIISPSFSGVVTAKIISVKPHPAADKLSLCDVTDGSQTYRVVCGAQNIKAGLPKVIFDFWQPSSFFMEARTSSYLF